MMKRLFAIMAAGLLLVACSEKPQALGKRKADAPAWSGAAAEPAAYTAGNWKAGDMAAWEAQLKTRAQGQNEYSRDAAP
jgi:hypothetical protein